jgi:NAD(P)-dependent dehydrogenase (short-subunit alcohol dehydrogenase family)/SAM-dependent methyltransferase/acyl carrier protein
VDWPAVAAGRGRPPADLPTYPFQRRAFPVVRAGRRAGTPAGSPLLGARLDAALEQAVFDAELGPGTLPFLEDHRIHGSLVLPSPAYLEMALAAGDALLGAAAAAVEDLVVGAALVLPERGGCRVQTIVEPAAAGAARFRVLAKEPGGGWRLHASGRVLALEAAAVPPGEPPDTIRGRLGAEAAPHALYESLARLGLEFGPAFRCIEAVAHGEGEALATLRLPPELAAEAASYRVHPALLDSCLQVLGAAFVGAAGEPADPFLLVGLDSLRVHRRPGERLLCHARLRRPPEGLSPEAEVLTADLRLLDEHGGLLADLGGVRLKRAPAGALQGPGRAAELLHEVVWRERPQAAPRPAAELAGSLAAAASDLAAAHGLDVYDRLTPGLDELCGLYAARAVEALGAALEPGAAVEEARLEAALGEGRHRRRLLSRILAWLAEDGLLAAAGAGTWSVERAPSAADPERLLERLREAFPACAAELEVLGRTGPGAGAALRGAADPLELLFPGGSLGAAERLYGASPSARAYGALTARAVAQAVESAPPDRRLRLVEVGAGTGGTTAHILEALEPGRVEYVFTDVSPLFVARAGERFAGREDMRFETLDVAADPRSQGFEAESFDVAVCANVLHATADLRASLRALRGLLRPGGLLVLLEATTRERFSDLTVGLTEGWWGFDDDVRDEDAVLPTARWLAVLAEEGFGGAAAVGGSPVDGPLARQALIMARSTRAARRWLVVGDGGGLGERLAARLRAGGERCDHLAATAGVAELQRAAGQVGGDDGPRLAAVHLGALDVPPAVDAAAEHSARPAAASVLALGQALLATAAPASLAVVTRGAQPAGGSVTAPLQAQAWGLARAAALEHGELGWARLDLDPGAAPGADLDALAAELLAGDSSEPEVAFRAGARLVPRLVRIALAAGPADGPALHPDASYLVTGGLRGLGLAVAEWLAARGARNLVLAGRRPPGPEALAAIERLEGAGVRVVALQADVSEAPGTERAVAAARELGPLRGVVHSAGQLDDGALLQLTPERLEAVAAPKVRGTLHLLDALGGAELDFLCLFSSGAALLGSAGQANHAAANAFLDGLASWLQVRGVPAVSIGWGPWAEIGAAAGRGAGAAPGVGRISPADGLEALRLALTPTPDGLPRRAYVAALPVDWTALAGACRVALLGELARPRARATAPVAAARGRREAGDLAADLAATAASRRLRVIEDRVRAEAASVLGLDAGQIADLEKPLSELGLDSLMAVELRDRIVVAAGRQLPATLLFEHPTVRALADVLAAELLPGIDGTEAAGPRSDDEIAALLARKLDAIAAGGAGG